MSSEDQIHYIRFEANEHLSGVLALCEAEGWEIPNLTADRALESFLAPGVCTMIAVHEGNVVGFAKMQSDGVLQAHLSVMAVDVRFRKGGIGKRLVQEALSRCGGERVDLLSAEDSRFFYESFPHKVRSGYRIYPGEG